MSLDRIAEMWGTIAIVVVVWAMVVVARGCL